MPKLLPIICFSLLIFSGCVPLAEKDYPIALPAKALESAVATADPSVFSDSSEWLNCPWWELFQDPQLEDFIEEALTWYPSVQIAKAKIDQAYFESARVRSALFPSIDFDTDYLRERLSKTGLLGIAATPPIPGIPQTIPLSYTQSELSLNLQYELDLWDKNRNAWRSAIGDVHAAIAEEALSRLALSISVAQIYYDLQTNYARKTIIQNLLRNRQKFEELTRKRIQQGLDNDLALLLIETDVVNAQDLLTQLEGSIAVQEHQLRAYLAGNFEDVIEPVAVSPQLLPQFPLPTRLPLDLLSHRPDIAAQIWRVEAAAASVEVAKAQFLPNVDLLGYIGFQTLTISQLFMWRSIYGAIGPAVHMPLFEGGALRANLGVQGTNYNLAVLQYNELVIKAVKEVLDGISVLQNTSQQVKENQELADIAKNQVHLTEARFKHHLNSSLDVLNIEQVALQAQDRLMVAQGQKIGAFLALIRALGGSYL